LHYKSIAMAKKSENCLNHISNIFEPVLVSKESVSNKSDAPELTFFTKSNKLNTNELTSWLTELLEKNNGEMILTLETTDNGNQLLESLTSVERQLDISITILRERKSSESQADENNDRTNYVIDFLVRKNHNNDDFIEVRVAIVGNVG
jgi:hypothetical protein